MMAMLRRFMQALNAQTRAEAARASLWRAYTAGVTEAQWPRLSGTRAVARRCAGHGGKEREPHRPRLGGYGQGRHLHDGDAFCRRPAGAAFESTARTRQRDDLVPDRRARAQGRRDRSQSHVCLTFVYAKEKVYLSITGKAF